MTFPVYRTSATGGSTSGTSDRTCTITPAVGDLLIVICAVAANTQSSPTCSDNNGSGAYALIGSTAIAYDDGGGTPINHRLAVFVRTTAMANTTSTVVTVATGSNTAGVVHVIAVSNMSNFGAAAVRQFASQANQAAGTPAPAFASAALTNNVTIGAVANCATGASMTTPTNWTERQDTGFASDPVGLEVVTRDSGFTGTTVTWGSASATKFASFILELDARRLMVAGNGSFALSGAVMTPKVTMPTTSGSFVVAGATAGLSYASGGGVTSVDPTTLAMKGLWALPYPGTTWPGTASTGPSGDANRTLDNSTGGVAPTVGTSLNGYATADHNGSTMFLDNALHLDQYEESTTPTVVTCWCLFKARTLNADNGAGTRYANVAFIVDRSDAYFQLGISAGGAHFTIDGNVVDCLVPSAATTTAWVLIQAKYNGTHVKLRAFVDGVGLVDGGWDTHVGTDTPSFIRPMRFGARYSGTAEFFDGLIGDRGIINTALSDAQLDGLALYYQTRYGLAFGLTAGGASTMTAAAGSFALAAAAAGLNVKMPGAAGSFALAGAATLFSVKMPTSAGTLTLTGQAATLAVSIPVAAGAYVLAGAAGILTKQSKLTATVSTYSLAGAATSFFVTMPAASGAFALSGAAALLGVKMPTSAGTLALTGANAGLTAQRRITISAATYAITGVAVVLAVKMPAVSGAYSLFGANAGVTKQSRLACVVGSFLESGGTAILTAQRKLTAQVGSIAFTGADATPRVTMPAAAAALSLAGGNAGVTAQRKLIAANAGFAISAANAGATVSRVVVALAAAFALTGNPAGFEVKMPTSAGTLAFSGADAGLTFAPAASSTLMAAPGTFALGAADAGLTPQRMASMTVGAFAIAGGDAGLSAARRAVAARGAFSVAGADANLRAARRLDAGAATFFFSGANAGLAHQTPGASVLSAGPGTFAFTGHQAGLAAQRSVFVDAGTIGIVGSATVLARGRALVADGAAFTSTGGDAAFDVERRLIAEPAELVVTGWSAAVRRDVLPFVATNASFIWTGASAGLTPGLAPITSRAVIRVTDRPFTTIRVEQTRRTVVRVVDAPFTRITIMPNFDILNIDDVGVFTMTFKVANVLTDPSALFIDLRRFAPPPADEDVTTYEYGADSELVRDSDGVFRFSFPCAVAGEYAAHIRATGAAAGGEDFYFKVLPSPV